MRENELEQRRIEAAKILAVLKKQETDLENIFLSQKRLRSTDPKIKNIFAERFAVGVLHAFIYTADGNMSIP